MGFAGNLYLHNNECGRLIFMNIYVHDLSNIMDDTTTRMYADDTNLTFTAYTK